ncbi:MAG: hypothetical protein CO141_00505, partial [Candidatus Moranbacteria bacterium CG_4_9_14_3_um_filter_42_9]
PIAPPWDEASKNFAYYLAKNVTGHDFYLLTNGMIPDLPVEIHLKPIYTSNDFSYLQKMRLVKHLHKMRKDFDIFHYIFTPTKQNAFLIKNFVAHKNGQSRVIQTIATLREDLYSDREIKYLIFGDLVITYSDYAKNKLNSLGFENVKRVYPGIALDEYKKTEKYEKLMREKNITKSNFVINFTGEYTRLGAIDLVIDSFLEVAKIIPEVKLSLAVRIKNDKDAQKKNEVLKKLKENNLLDKVSFFDDGNYKMPPVYNLCDISIFPVSNMRGKFDVPLAVIEAMACEKPVIISDLPILREFATPDNSVIIPKESTAALSKAIFALYENPIRRQEIGKIARNFVETNFDIKKVAEIYRQIYEKL